MTVIDVLLYIVASWEMLFLIGAVMARKKAQYYVFSCNLSLTGSYQRRTFFFCLLVFFRSRYLSIRIGP